MDCPRPPKVFWATGEGLSQYQQPADKSLRDHPSKWPRLCLSLDQESSNICAAGYLDRALNLCLEKWWDLPHGCWRDIIASLKVAGLWSCTLVCLIGYNCPMGPWTDDARYHQCVGAMQHLMQGGNPHRCPLFQGMFADLHAEMIADGFTPDPAASDAETAVWNELARNTVWENKGDKVSLNRFMGVTKKASVECRHWFRRGFAYTYLCLEAGFFGGAKFRRLMQKDPLAGAPGSSTSAKRITDVEKTLRSACANTVVIAALVYSNTDFLFKQKIIVGLVAPLHDWHSQQVKACRSASGTQVFLADQVTGGFLQTLSQVAAVTQNAGELARMGFALPVKPLGARSGADDLMRDIVRENEFAVELGTLALSLIGHRAKRCAFFLRGWPGRSAAFLAGGNVAKKHMSEFQKDIAAYDLLKDLELPQAAPILERSTFDTCAVQQLRHLAQEGDYELTEGFLKWVGEANLKNITTMLSEDAFNRQKHKTSRQQSHKAREQRAFGTLIDKQVLSKVHGYNEVKAQASNHHSRTEKLPSSAFRASFGGSSIDDMVKVIGRNEGAKPHWYSPGVDALPSEHLDLHLVRWCGDHQCLQLLGQAWLGMFAKASHQILLRVVTEQDACGCRQQSCYGACAGQLGWASRLP